MLSITLFTGIATAQFNYDFEVGGIYYEITCLNPAIVAVWGYACENEYIYFGAVTIPAKVDFPIQKYDGKA